jgi:hypothetical protein
MMPTTPASAARERSGHIHVEQRGWTLLKYGSLRMPVIRDTHDEAHAAAVKFWRDHTAAGRGAAG